MGWLAPTLYYVMAVGALGVASKLALRSLVWESMFVWAGIVYGLVALVLFVSGRGSFKTTADGLWALVAAVLAVSALISLYIALNTGKAGIVVPITAAYPAVTLLLAALFLDEQVTAAKLLGVGLVVGGVVVLTTFR